MKVPAGEAEVDRRLAEGVEASEHRYAEVGSRP